MMNRLITLFMLLGVLWAQTSDLYKRPFHGKPDFDIDVLHYEINLKINDHEKSFYGITSIEFLTKRSRLDSVRFDTETFTVTQVQRHIIFAVCSGKWRFDYNSISTTLHG